jgi:hypothetical protein
MAKSACTLHAAMATAAFTWRDKEYTRVSRKSALLTKILLVRVFTILITLVLGMSLFAEVPSPELPHVYIDTHWAPPSGGKTWRVHTANEFQHALNSSDPGDIIVLDGGVRYQGSFNVPARYNPDRKWTYIEGSELASLPVAGKRVDPARDAAKMPKIVATDTSPGVGVLAGASYVRFVGLEFYSASNKGCDLSHKPRVNCFTYFLLDMPAQQGKSLPDSITVDRCYMHGSDTQDVRAAVVANGTNVAVIDSYISDIHQSTSDSQAIRAYRTPGPIKVVNNFLSSTTENLMFGGAGGADNPYVASDLDIRKNHFFKPEGWAKPGVTLPPAPQWSVKNSLEFKSARRVLVTGNVFENNWASAQKGYAIVLSVRTSDSGNIAVVNDVTIENNVLKNVASGFNSLERDDNCRLSLAPLCNNPGEARRWKIANNLLLFRSSSAPGVLRSVAFQVLPDVTDVVFQHNTIASGDGADCWASVYFSVPGGSRWPLAQSDTHNFWITDNILCQPPTGDWGGEGTFGLMNYMGDPPPVEKRFSGNVIVSPKNSKLANFPAGNLVTAGPIRYTDPQTGNYQLTSPKWVKTTDGKPAGVDAHVLDAAVSGVVSTTISGH